MKTHNRGVFQLAGATLVSLGLLSACATQDNTQTIAADTPVAQEAEAEQIVTPELPTLAFRWPLGEGTLIAPPITIQRDAIEACRVRGYDTSYMINVGIDGDIAVGKFGCRGAD